MASATQDLEATKQFVADINRDASDINRSITNVLIRIATRNRGFKTELR